MSWSRLLTVLLLCASALLAGCAGPRLVESDVSSYSTMHRLPSPPTYRIDLLPSQQSQLTVFGPIREQAEQALARAGLTRDDARPSLLVELGAEGGLAVPAYWPYYGDPFYGRFGWGMGFGGWHRHAGFGMGWMMDAPPTLYHRQVSIVMRDAGTRQVVFESSAVYEEVWTSDPFIYGVLFDQALSGFPTPPSGLRKVRTEILPPPKPGADAAPAADTVPAPAPAPAKP